MRHMMKTVVGTVLAAGFLSVGVGVLPAVAETAQVPATSSVVTSAATSHGGGPSASVSHARAAATPDDTDPAKDSVVKSIKHDGTDSIWFVAITAALVFIIVGGVSIISYRRSSS